jgi:hypothetical protein
MVLIPSKDTILTKLLLVFVLYNICVLSCVVASPQFSVLLTLARRDGAMILKAVRDMCL